MPRKGNFIKTANSCSLGVGTEIGQKESFGGMEIWDFAAICKTVNLFKTTEHSKWVKFIVCKLYINNV